MVRWRVDLVCAAVSPDWGHVAMLLEWGAAVRCGEGALLERGNFIEPLSEHDALVVDWGALPKAFKAKPRRTVRYVMIAVENPVALRKVIARMVDREDLVVFGIRAVVKILEPYNVTSHTAAGVIGHRFALRMLFRF
ncbi:hypothetical protein TRVL_09293 [Trypanosoma vivax]|nr:hypothetical protein TRVL_09293 [Trypanosoma vivax]